jgi:hypothetical protein
MNMPNMKASELRIGNLVDLGNRIAKVTEINHLACVVVDLEETQDTIEDYERVKGIILTEEWLLNFGFEKNNNNQFILMKGSVDILFNKDLNGWTCDGINFSINMTEHVHQLQNLYFALTGEELILNI